MNAHLDPVVAVNWRIDVVNMVFSRGEDVLVKLQEVFEGCFAQVVALIGVLLLLLA